MLYVDLNSLTQNINKVLFY